MFYRLVQVKSTVTNREIRRIVGKRDDVFVLASKYDKFGTEVFDEVDVVAAIQTRLACVIVTDNQAPDNMFLCDDGIVIVGDVNDTYWIHDDEYDEHFA
jgi:hypothetical protein